MKRYALIVLTLLSVAILFSLGNPSQVLARSETSRVWVEFAPNAKMLVRSALNQAGAQFHYEFDDLNSFVVSLPSQAINGILRNPNVVAVEPDPARFPIEASLSSLDFSDVEDPNHEGQIIPYGVDMVQARQLWDKNNDGVVDNDAPTGAGITVCIIDTGYLADHEDLADAPPVTGMSQVDNEWDYDGYGHGTHVAGTISALNNNLGVVGVTPGTVNFHIVKYFDNDGVYVSRASDLVAAINNCAANGAKVINMSLGGSSSSVKERRAFDNLYAQGVLSIAAAGNDNSSAPHYPSSYSSVVSVAAVDSTGAKADFSNYGPYIELAAPGVDVLSTLPYIEVAELTVNGSTYSGGIMENAATGSASGALVDGGLCASAGAWSGKVVLCERGVYSFAQKVLAVQSGGGVAAVVYNNEPGLFYGTLDPDYANIPAISLSQEDGQTLVANNLNDSADIYTEHTQPASGYQAWGGTSMATPHVAGVAALLWSADTSLTNVQIRAAMNETALDLGATGWDQYFGNGLVQAAAALDYLGLGSGDQVPTVTINAPADGASFESGSAITFAGVAGDAEDGDLTSQLVWTSSLQGQIGTGSGFSVVLLDGNHTISASVTDSGGNTAQDTITVSVYVVGDNPPTVNISAPADGASFDSGTNISFAGTASDDEDGDLSEDLVWTSSLDGPIGNGPSFSKSDLSVGTHTITASVTDSGGNTAEDVITVTVTSPATGQLVVAVSTDKASYSSGETVYITVEVDDDGGAPVGGAEVTVRITTPKNKVYTGTSSTDASGTVVFTFSLFTARDGKGDYSVEATATKDGYTAGSATISFYAK